MEIVSFLQSLFTPLLTFLGQYTFGLNGLDLVILAIILFYAYEGYSLGFIHAFSDLLSFILSFILALKVYGFIGKVLIAIFSLPPGFANAIGFFLAALIIEIILSILFRKLLHKIPPADPDMRIVQIFRPLDKFLGLLPGVLSAFILLAFLLSVVIALPSSPYLKGIVSSSRIGSLLVANTATVERTLNDIFGGAISESLTFMTVKPKSDERVDLDFTVTDGNIDPKAEEQMLVLLNRERVKIGLNALEMDIGLRKLSRDHSDDMFKRGYFSHVNPDGLDPFNRMDEAGVIYTNAGENLALAPSVELAMQGLMNSPGHRANILSDKYNKIGIGVIDGGVYGKMFTQEFTN